MASVSIPANNPANDRQILVSDWRRCLWKDWRSIRGLLSGVILALLMLQLAFVVAGFFSNPSFQKDRWTAAVYVSLVGPVIMSLACVGLFIGKERDDGSWNWNSSLPIAWHVSLSSNLVVASISILVSLACLLVVPLFTIAAAGIEPATFASQVFLTLLSCVEMLLIVGIFLLLIREAVIAIVMGLLCIGSCQLLLFATIEHWTASNANSPVAAILLVVLSGIVIAIGFVGFVYAYQWRWTSGQLVVLGRFFSIRTSRRTSWAITPTRRYTTLWLSWAQSQWLRLISVMICMLPLSIGVTEFPVGFLGMTLLGMSTFAGDQTRQRFRFLADRGATSRDLLVPRLLVSLCIAIPIGICMLWFGVAYAPLVNVPPIRAVLLGFMFASGCMAAVCFRSIVVAIAVSLIASLAIAIVAFETRELVRTQSGIVFIDPIIQLSIAVWIVLAFAVWLYLLQRWVRRWLILDKSNLAWRYFVMLPLALLTMAPLAAVVGITFGFLMLPSIDSGPVKLASIAELKAIVHPQVELNPLLAATERISSATLLRVANESNIGIANRLLVQLEKDLEIQNSDAYAATSKVDRTGLLSDLRWEASQVEKAIELPMRQPENGYHYVLQKRQLAIRYLLLTKLAIHENDEMLASQFFASFRRLTEINSSSALFTVGFDGTIWKMLCTFQRKEMEALGGVPEFNRLLDLESGSKYNDEHTRIHTSAVVAFLGAPDSLPQSLRRLLLMPDRRPIAFLYPPARWYYQRSIVAQMQKYIGGTRTTTDDLDKRLFRQHLFNVSKK